MRSIFRFWRSCGAVLGVIAVGAVWHFLVGSPSGEEIVGRIIASEGLSGGVLAVRRSDGALEVSAFGGVDRNAALRIASLSKPITSAAIHSLVADGALALDEPVWPLLDLPEPADPRWRVVTVRHLLQHMGGWDRTIGGDPLYLPEPVSCRTAARRMVAHPLDFDPGQRYAYSNFGYCLLGLVVERVTGQSYAEHIVSRFVDPLGLTSFQLSADLDPASGGWMASAPELATLFASLNVDPVAVAPTISWQRSYPGLGWRVWPADENLTHAGNLPEAFTLAVRRRDGTVIVVLLVGRIDDFPSAWPRLYQLVKKI